MNGPVFSSLARSKEASRALVKAQNASLLAWRLCFSRSGHIGATPVQMDLARCSVGHIPHSELNQRASQVAQWQIIGLPSRRHKFNPWVRKIPWIRKWQATPVFLPGESHGQKLEGLYVAHTWVKKESDVTEQLNSRDSNPEGKTLRRQRICSLAQPATSTTSSFPPRKTEYVCVCAQSCPTLCDLVDCSLPGSLIHGIFPARILECTAMTSSRGS